MMAEETPRGVTAITVRYKSGKRTTQASRVPNDNHVDSCWNGKSQNIKERCTKSRNKRTLNTQKGGKCMHSRYTQTDFKEDDETPCTLSDHDASISFDDWLVDFQHLPSQSPSPSPFPSSSVESTPRQRQEMRHKQFRSVAEEIPMRAKTSCPRASVPVRGLPRLNLYESQLRSSSTESVHKGMRASRDRNRVHG